MNSVQQITKETAEKTARSIFVGNIPYEATEEKLVDMFAKAGPVVSFRLVYDRESGKPKGYGFCEYTSPAIAASALRNLMTIEFNGRPLRIGPAAGEQNSAELAMANGIFGPPQDTPFGNPVEPSSAPEAITKAVASLPPEQMYELMKQMKLCIQNNPNEARNMLLQNPQLAYALLQAQIVMKIVDPKVAIAMLNRSHDQIPPIQPDSTMPPVGNSGVSRENITDKRRFMETKEQLMDMADSDIRMEMGQMTKRSTFPSDYPGPPGINTSPMAQPSRDPYIKQMPPQNIQPPGMMRQNMPQRMPPPRVNNQRSSQITPQVAAAFAANMGSNPMLAGQDEQEKVALIMQVLQLTDDQISLLPEDQRRSILILKDQLGKTGAIPN